MVVYLSSSKSDKIVSTKIELQNKKNIFTFKNILSGQYKVFIKKLEWCWNHEEINVKVQNTKIDNLIFKQTGYSLFYASQYDIPVSIENINDPKIKLTNFLKSQETKLCLPKEGEYKVTPKSCHKFEKSVFNYSTKSIDRLNITPIEFMVKGKLEINSKVYQILNNDISTLKIDILIEEITSDAIISYKTIDKLVTKDKRTNFDFYSKPKTNLLISPEVSLSNPNTNSTDLILASQKLLFYPKFKQIKIEESCYENPENLSFELRSGLVLSGKVSPPMEGVKILSYNKENNELIAQTETLKDGSYIIGPLYTEFKYNVHALKDGYKISKVDEKSNNFTAEKLSFLRVKIVDINNKPLPSVFISLSSANKGFKLNNNTNAEGYFDFYELYSGEYYIKPLLKEYKFDPVQKQINIVGGEHYEEIIVAHRVAFSVYGKVNNLNKDKVEGISIQAVNVKTQQITETLLDKNNEYRLRGLNPNQSYIFKVKIPIKSNIEKALPQATQVHLGKADVTGINFILLNKPKKVDLRGFLSFSDEEDKCQTERVKNIRIELKELNENEEKEATVKKMPFTCQFVLPKLDKTQYSIRLIEKQGATYTKTIYENTLDLNDDREVIDGVKLLEIKLTKSKGSLQDHLNYSIFSPAFICIMLLLFFNGKNLYDSLKHFLPSLCINNHKLH